MKFIFTFLFLVAGFHVFSQWSDTTNSFTDSLHMQVTTAARNQQKAIIVRSYPDSGYFVIWQDSRNDPANAKSSIYAQKYNKAGVALWAANGVAVSAGSNNQHYVYQLGQDYRNHSYAVTDSAGGFYIAYADDSVASYIYQRACLQHIQSNGTPVFGGPGNIIYSSTAGNFTTSPQLIADGTGGVFYSFIGAEAVTGVPINLYIFCYKDVNGTLHNLGGGLMDQNAIQQTSSSPCGNYTYLQYTAAEVDDYNIFSDLQGGCNVIMQLSVSGQGVKVGYNKLWRAKKNSVATEYSLDPNYNPVANPINYTKDSIYRLYYLKTDNQTISCGSGVNLYTVTQYRLIQNGFQEIDGGVTLYDLKDPKAVTVSTTGNINASLLTVWERTYINNTVSDPIINAYVVKEEIYDSIPYQRTSNTNPNYPGYNYTEPGSLNKLNNFRDTVLPAPFNYDFSLAGGANQIYAASVDVSGGTARLQHLAVEAQTADSFALVYKMNAKQATIIGKGSYDLPPLLAADNAGNAVYYIKDNTVAPGAGGAPRVSPVLTGTDLAWGAMGKPIGTGIWGSFYNIYWPYLSLDPVNGSALIAWTDDRNNGTTGYDIYMRHLDDLTNPNYQPPYVRVKPVTNPYGPPTATATLYGSTNQFSTFEVSDESYTTDPGVSPVVDILDNYNLGTVNLTVSDNAGAIRTTTDGKPYLDRSYTITPQNNPNGAATITLRLLFTTAQFNALKAADPTIQTPGDLAVVKQPGTGSGSTYTIVAGEQTLIPQSWGAINGGYYIQIQITSFSNFFIFKNANALPVTWLGVQAQWQNTVQAKVSWQIAEQQDVKNYRVQQSTNGLDFANVCIVEASTQSEYNCVVPAGNSNYYRVVETDIDGQKAYSQVVQLQSNAAPPISLYPNPAKDNLYINGIQKYYFLQVIDMKGNTVLQQSATPANRLLDISKLSRGNYLLRLTSNSAVQTFKFVKQ